MRRVEEFAALRDGDFLRDGPMSHGPASRRAFLRKTAVLGGVPALPAVSNSASLFAAGPAERPSALKITNVETFLLRHKLPRAIGVSIALSDVRQSLVVKISSDSGLIGWGEAAEIGGARAVIENKIKPALLGKNPLDKRALWQAMWGANFGDGRAVGGVDLALDDLRGKALGVPVAELYGGRLRNKVLAYASGMNYTDGIEPEAQFPEEAAGLARRGFRALKMRTGRFESRRDLAVLAKVRDAVGPNVRLLTDANGAFTLHEAVRFGKELEKLDFYCFEEPLPQGLDYAGYDEVTAALDIAVAGGEVLDSRVAARDHIVRRSFDIIQPDVILCGGIAEMLFIAEMARLWSIPCLPHCWSGGIGLAGTVQAVSLLPNATFGRTAEEPMLEMDTAENPFREKLLVQPFQLHDGYVDVPTRPGLGIEIDETVLDQYRVD